MLAAFVSILLTAEMDEQRQGRETEPIGSDELALLVESVEDYAMFILDPTGIIRSWNRGAHRLMGYDGPEVIGKHFSIFYGPADVADRKPERELEIAAAEGRVEQEGWRVRSDARRFWANTVITALRNPDGGLRGFAKVTRDLTQRREAEERLRQNEEMFRLLVSSVKDYAIFMLDPDGRVATWNEGAHRIKGYEPGEIIGQHFSVFYPPEDVAAGKPEWKLRAAEAQGSVEDEGWRVRKDGTRFWANVVITAVHDSDGRLRGFAKVTRDITERKRAEDLQRTVAEQREARLRAEAERHRAESHYRAAQEANRSKDEFLMTLSHELRTPMTAILGWARLLPALSPDDETFQEAVASIGRSAQIQARLIDDVLDVSRIVSGKLRLNLETVDVARLLESATDAVRPSAAAKDIHIEMQVSPSLGLVVADPTRLQQIIWNLLTNAVKFTPRGGLITVRGIRTASHLEVSITDTGEGIDPGFLPHVFEPFRQAENPRTRTHGGLGLGLSIVRYMTEAHGGSVSAQSQGRGRGSTFTIVIPIAALRRSKRDRSGARGGDSIATRRLAGSRILVVEDDREGRDLVRTILQQAGATVIAVDAASVALDQLSYNRPDLVVSDIGMPGMDGYELLRLIREKHPGLKVVALSAFPGNAGADQTSKFDDYLLKPIDPLQLVEAIARVRDVA